MASQTTEEFKNAIYNLIASLGYGEEYDSFRWSQFTEHMVLFAYEYGYQVGLAVGLGVKDPITGELKEAK
jgi:hypothetical protein